VAWWLAPTRPWYVKRPAYAVLITRISAGSQYSENRRKKDRRGRDCPGDPAVPVGEGPEEGLGVGWSMLRVIGRPPGEIRLGDSFSS
jgi:hypothetical protein